MVINWRNLSHWGWNWTPKVDLSCLCNHPWNVFSEVRGQQWGFLLCWHECRVTIDPSRCCFPPPTRSHASHTAQIQIPARCSPLMWRAAAGGVWGGQRFWGPAASVDSVASSSDDPAGRRVDSPPPPSRDRVGPFGPHKGSPHKSTADFYPSLCFFFSSKRCVCSPSSSSDWKMVQSSNMDSYLWPPDGLYTSAPCMGISSPGTAIPTYSIWSMAAVKILPQKENCLPRHRRKRWSPSTLIKLEECPCYVSWMERLFASIVFSAADNLRTR